MIRYLKHEDIDPAKWDACIERAANGLIYAYSFYLDHMSPSWDGLILGDYEAVMPLTWRKKFGIRYLYQPAFVAHAGVFGNNLHEKIIDEFIAAIPKKFKLIEINLNAGNIFSASPKFEHLRKNYVLPLNAPYETLYDNYRGNVRADIKKAQASGCIVKTGIPAAEIIQLAKEQLNTVVRLRENDLLQFRDLCTYLQEQKKAITYGVFNNNGLLASGIFFFSHHRAYYIIAGNHPAGKTKGASAFLMDRFIQDHASSKLVLDFEGGDIKSLAFFFSRFGANLETYPALRIDRLPWYIKTFRGTVAFTVALITQSL